MRQYREKNRVVSFSSSTAQGLESSINKWFEKNLDVADNDVEYLKGLSFYSLGNTQHCAMLHWVEDFEVKDDENEETSD